MLCNVFGEAGVWMPNYFAPSYAQGGRYRTALQAASAKGHKEVVEILRDKGANVNIQNGEYGTALQAASEGGHKEIVEMLLGKGADVNAEGGYYGTALQVASA
jgi:ankyrin repeat protein